VGGGLDLYLKVGFPNRYIHGGGHGSLDLGLWDGLPFEAIKLIARRLVPKRSHFSPTYSGSWGPK